jgi:integrase
MSIASSTAVYLYRRAITGANRPRNHGRRALIAVLGCGGLRASELAALDSSDIDLEHCKIVVGDAKTESGVREGRRHAPPRQRAPRVRRHPT